MSQQNIDFGTFPDDPSADAIRTAFQKVQENFDEVYAATANAAVLSINRTAGRGITVNSPTGNVVVEANVASISISSVTLRIGTTPNPVTTSALYTNFSQTLYIEVPSTLSITNLIASGNISAGGNITSNNANLGNAVVANYFIGDGNQLSNVTAILANVANVAGTVSQNAQPNITSLGTLTSLTVSGNIIAGNIYANTGIIGAQYLKGDGSNLTNLSIPGANVIGQVANALVAGTVYTNAQPNITSTGILTSVSVSGNSNIGNVGTGIITATGTITGGNLSTTGILSVSGNTTLANLSVTGTLTAGDITVGSISNGTSIVDIVGVSGNVTTSVAGVANILVITTAGANIEGTLSVNGNINAGNVTATTFIGSLNGVATSATTAGTVTTNAQPNITSLGTLSSVTVNGTANLGAIGNVKISGNSGFLQSDGNGNLSFSSVITQNIPGTANTVLLSDGANTISASGNIKFNDPQLDITGTLSVSGNVNVGNISATNIVGTLTTNAQPNITSVGTLTSLALGGNLNSNSSIILNNVNADITTLGNVSANYFIGNTQGANVTGQVANALVSGTVYSNAQPNITSLGTITGLTSTGNITAPYFLGNIIGNISGNLIVPGTNTSVLFNQQGNAGASDAFQFNYATNVATIIGNLSATNITGNGAGLTAITGANVTGTVANATTAGTVTTNSQPNITSVGTLTGLVVGGDITPNANITYSLGNNTNRFNNLYLSGNTIILGAQTISANATSISISGNLSGDASGLSNITGANVTGTVANATTAGTVTTAAQPNITSTGTLTSLSVTGNISAGNVSATTFTGALSGAATTAGTVTASAQPNIQSTGTLVALVVSGQLTASTLDINASGGITTNQNFFVLANTNASTVNFAGAATELNMGAANGTTTIRNALSVAGNLTTTGILSVTGTGVSSIAGNLDMTSNNIVNLASPTNPNDAATKQYVDDVAQGLHTHDSCNAATQTTLATISGGVVTYDNGTSGVGATLTTTGTYTTIDGVTLLNDMRILVKNEANTAHNGIYDRTSSTVLTRSADFDTPTEMAGGDFTFVTAGTLYDNTGWVMTDLVTTVGTSPVVWTQFSGAGTYTAGTGLTLTGSQFSITNTSVSAGSYGNGDSVASFTVNGQGQLTAAANVVITANAANLSGTVLKSTVVTSSLTSVGTLDSLAVTGNISAGNVSATTFTGALSGAATTAGTVTTAAQPNITSVGTLTTLSVNGTATAVSFATTTGVFTGNGSGLSAIAGGNVTGAVSYATTANSVAGANVSGEVTFAATANAVAGANVSGQVGNALVAGTVYTAAQPNITSTGTLTSLTVTGNVAAGNVTTAGQLVSSVATGTAPLVVTSTTQVANLNVATAGSATTAGTVTTDAQPNITSVGTLTSLGISGTITSSAATCLSTTVSGTNSANLIYGNMGDNDQFRILVGATATNAGYVEIATADDGTEPIYVRQYSGVFTTLTRTATLLDGSGNTSFPGSVTAGGFVQTTSLTTGAAATAGTITGNWSLSGGSRLNATYADLAEKYVADATYEPGTVLVFGGEHEVTLSTESDSFRVAGVVTTNPAYTMNNDCAGEHVATIALQGRVPAKVIGPVFKGDLLVSCGNGYAIANNIARAGTIIGKSLENFTDSSGIIEVAVGRF